MKDILLPLRKCIVGDILSLNGMMNVTVDAVVFMRRQKEENSKLEWNKTWWRYLQLPDLVIENAKKNS